MSKTIEIEYYAQLRDEAGCSNETFETSANNLEDLYQELSASRGLTIAVAKLRVAVNDEFSDWEDSFSPGDKIVFIPPVAGG